jgi:hypothetical protein
MLSVPNVNPGVYPGPGQASILRANEQQWLLQNQLVAAGGITTAAGGNNSASIAVQLERLKGAAYPFGASLQVYFTNAAGAPSSPGAFEIDWQNSDIDSDQNFVTMSSLVGTGSLNASFSGRIELATMWARFMRVYLKSNPNGVYVSALVTR